MQELDNRQIDKYRLRLEFVGRARFVDQRNFALYLLDAKGNRPGAPVFRGLYNAGRPSIHVPAWIDGEFVEDALPLAQVVAAQLDDELVDRHDAPSPLLEENLASRPTPSSHRLPPAVHPIAESIAQLLGQVIPAGGRLWIAYEAFAGEGDLARETRAALIARMPLIATPIGFLLFRAGCYAGLRDWDIPEGGREGPRKIQGNKPLNTEHARERAREIIASLAGFLAQAPPSDLWRRGQARAQIILPAMEGLVQSSP